MLRRRRWRLRQQLNLRGAVREASAFASDVFAVAADAAAAVLLCQPTPRWLMPPAFVVAVPALLSADAAAG